MGSHVQLINSETKVKVSSTLDKSVRKKYLTDGNVETCWSSQQGTPQFIQLTFASPVVPRKLHITFQGGFVGTICCLELPSQIEDDKKGWRTWTQVFPEDVNRSQIFDLPTEGVEDGVESLRLLFVKSSDFFGRITVYDIQLLGTIMQ